MFKTNKSISLIGMPGCGKTSVARELGKITKIPVFDADKEIEISAGRSINDIFQEFGEDEFRIGEYRVIKRILSGEIGILSTGGGAFINEKTRAVINKNSISVFIDVSIEHLWNRVKGKKHRPLLNGKDAKSDLENIFNQRYDIYKKADIIIKYGNNKTPNKLAKEIIEKLNEYDS